MGKKSQATIDRENAEKPGRIMAECIVMMQSLPEFERQAVLIGIQSYFAAKENHANPADSTGDHADVS